MANTTDNDLRQTRYNLEDLNAKKDIEMWTKEEHQESADNAYGDDQKRQSSLQLFGYRWYL